MDDQTHTGPATRDHGEWLVFDVRTDTNDNGGGKVREYRCLDFATHATHISYHKFSCYRGSHR